PIGPSPTGRAIAIPNRSRHRPEGDLMRLASLSRRPLARLAAAAAALTLLAAGCLPLGEDEPAPGDDPATQDDGDGQDGQQEGPELAELGTSAAQELPTDPAEDAAYAAYYEQGIEWGPCS